MADEGDFGSNLGSKAKMLKKFWFLKRFFERSRKPGAFSENEQLGERRRLEGGRGRVNLPPGGLASGFGGLESLELSSEHLHA